jgi:integrase
LPDSARRSLAHFRDPAVVRAFLALPDRIVEDVERRKKVDRPAASRIAAALWIKITQRAPLRISNLLGADLTKNILRSHNGKDAVVSLYFPPEQVKNDKAIEVPLPQATVGLLNLYLSKYRKALIDVASPYLFPQADGERKRSATMSHAVQHLMREYLGFAVNPHSFRHIAAKLYLSVHPGRYSDVQNLLAHAKLETTRAYYCEQQTEESFKHFDAVLLKLEQPEAKEVSE